ncbi:MAG: TIGR01777 family oxidoreductase [Phycisphaerales bacterium]|nr:TIGR01777 family oxidoreductase [Phycisphaerales bacterium]
MDPSTLSVSIMSMKIFITGASGTIGRRIVADRLAKGDHVLALTRDRSRLASLEQQNPARGTVEIVEGDPNIPGPWQKQIDGCDAVIHLAGAGVLDRRWTAAYLEELRRSRVDSTYQVVRACEQALQPPRSLLSASAIGFYGDRDDRQLVETDECGEGFLSRLCAEWEAQAMRAEPTVRVACMRFGMILDPQGGALKRMLGIFRLGLGGRIGNGRQYVSWITWQDMVAMVDLLLRHQDIHGPVNMVSPEPITNRIFTRAMGHVLRRPTLFPAPAFGLKLLLGGGAEVVLSSQRVIPEVMSKASFQWLSPTIDRALRTVLRKSDEAGSPKTSSAIIIDIDGLSPGEPLLRRSLRQASQSGSNVVLATSMGPEGAREFLTQSRMDCPVIVADGAAIIQRDLRTVLDMRELLPAIQAGLLKALADCGHSLEVTLEDIHGARRISSDLQALQPIKDCIRMRIKGTEQALKVVQAAIGPDFWKPRRIQVHLDRPGRMDVLAAMADRSVALQRLAKQWQIDRNDIKAILMNIRSRGLAQWCANGIAISGADEGVVRLCGRTSSQTGMQGLAESIDQLL